MFINIFVYRGTRCKDDFIERKEESLMIKDTNNQEEILDTENILGNYMENLELIQQSLKQLELVISKLQSEGLVEIEKLANEISMLQKLSTSIEFKAKLITCNKGDSIETLPYK